MENELAEFWNQFYKHAEKATKGPPTLFRGVSDESYKLIPSVGRGTSAGTFEDISSLEDSLISNFKRLSTPVLSKEPKTDFEWLFLAQHYGLPTRLLDWSSNPMVGLFFAASSDDGVNGALYTTDHQVSDQYDLFDFRTADAAEKGKAGTMSSLFALQPGQGETIFIRPKYTDERYINQKSVFSCQADPFKEATLTNIEKIIVRKEHKPAIREMLRTMGISHSYIYPGLEGITQEIKSYDFNPVVEGRRKTMTITAHLQMPFDSNKQ